MQNGDLQNFESCKVRRFVADVGYQYEMIRVTPLTAWWANSKNSWLDQLGSEWAASAGSITV